MNAVIIYDSKPALQPLSATRHTRLLVVQQILSFLFSMAARAICVKFIKVPFHVGAYFLVVMDNLSPYHDTSPGSVPQLSCLCGVAGKLRGLTESPLTTTRPSAATSISTVVEGYGSAAQRSLGASAAGVPSAVANCWGGRRTSLHRMLPVSCTTFQHPRTLLSGVPRCSSPTASRSFTRYCLPPFWCLTLSTRFSYATLALKDSPVLTLHSSC